MTETYRPLGSLQKGRWFKLICGASFQHLPAVRNLALAYALAGADCIDIAADPSVITIVREALEIAQQLAPKFKGLTKVDSIPWLMVSLNDGEDPHFRKAQFDPDHCPPDCHRPCQAICPTQAISFQQDQFTDAGTRRGVFEDRCYGCGRCLSICPHDRIAAFSHIASPETIAPLVLAGIDAVEIHTQPGRLQAFKRLWQTIQPWVNRLKLVAISCPDGEGLIDYLRSLYDFITPLPCPLVWQADGRPMSGDIGNGATRAAIKLGQKLLAAQLPGYVQLAGGTNGHTVTKLQSLGLLNLEDQTKKFPSKEQLIPMSPHGLGATSPAYIAGVAYGSYARSLLLPLLEQLDKIELDHMYYKRAALRTPAQKSSVELMAPAPSTTSPPLCLETFPDLLWQGVEIAHSLVSQIKFL